MKLRTLYLLVLVCCMTLMSTASGNGESCAKSQLNVPAMEQLETAPDGETGFNFSPLERFSLGI